MMRMQKRGLERNKGGNYEMEVERLDAIERTKIYFVRSPILNNLICGNFCIKELLYACYQICSSLEV